MKLSSLESLNAAIRMVVEKYPGCSPKEVEDHWHKLFDEKLDPGDYGLVGGVQDLLILLSQQFQSLEFRQNSGGYVTVHLPKVTLILI